MIYFNVVTMAVDVKSFYAYIVIYCDSSTDTPSAINNYGESVTWNVVNLISVSEYLMMFEYILGTYIHMMDMQYLFIQEHTYQ